MIPNSVTRTLTDTPLRETRAPAGARTPEALRAAARQFEALFLERVLKSMRDALPNEDPLASNATRLYHSMLDQHVSQALAARGLGLADEIARQLARVQSAPREPQPTAAPAAPATKPSSAASAPEDFVHRMLPHARAAEQSYGIPAAFAMGQAALESGWGKNEIRHPDGSPTYNLFGIKAGASWRGRSVEVPTTEVIDGQPVRTVERFRAYASYDEAFQDHARLLVTTPRYAGTVEAGRDAEAFARSVHAGGYATDPDYASKLERVIARTTVALAGTGTRAG